MPLNQVASLSIPEPTLIVAQPFDPSLMGAIEKAIRASNLGLNPTNDGKVVRIPIPALTEERRKELSKLVHKHAEEGRNGVRQVRRDANDRLKKLLKDHSISEDDERRGLDEVQKMTDQHIASIDDLQKKKDGGTAEQVRIADRGLMIADWRLLGFSIDNPHSSISNSLCPTSPTSNAASRAALPSYDRSCATPPLHVRRSPAGPLRSWRPPGAGNRQRWPGASRPCGAIAS